MGHLLSCLTKTSTSALLRLPVEVVLLIASYLASDSPESVATLSLTCKSLRLALMRRVADLQSDYRGKLLQLLQRDIGDRFYFCPLCCKLHRFRPDCTINDTGYFLDKHIHIAGHIELHFTPNPYSTQQSLYVLTCHFMQMLKQNIY
jgi:hypothetical protein